MIHSFSIGIMFAVIVMGLLPFLLIFSWAEISGISELCVSPLILIQKLYKEEE